MAWNSVLGGLSDITEQLTYRNDDDWYDRLSHRWTAFGLVAMSVLLTTKQYVGEPITCWVPKHFSGAWEDYTNSYCWVSNTYYMGWREDIPQELAARGSRPIVYYQWVPMLLMMQAMLFHMPITVWRAFNARSGLDFNDIIETMEKYQITEDKDLRNTILHVITKQLDAYLSRKWRRRNLTRRSSTRRLLSAASGEQSYPHHGASCCGNLEGSYITVLYVLIKLLFLMTTVSQLFVMNLFLGQNYSMYGIEVVQTVLANKDWTESERFPRVTFCDFDIRRLANVHRYTVQCVLPINMFNERIYLLLWFWTLFMALLTLLGLMAWLVRLVNSPGQQTYLTERLRQSASDKFDHNIKNHRQLMKYFINDYLKLDGYLLIKLVDLNTRKDTAADLVAAVWGYWLTKPSRYRRMIRHNCEV